MTFAHLLTAGFVAFLASAQASGRDLKQHTSFFSYNEGRAKTKVFVKVSQNRFHELTLLGTRLTDPIRVLNEDGRIHLYGEPEAKEFGKEEHPLIGSIACEQQWKQAALVFSLQWQGSHWAAEGSSFSLHHRDFPKETLKILNRIPSSLRGTIGSQTINLPPRQSLNFQFSSNEPEELNVAFQYQEKGENGRWLRCFSTRWFHEQVSGRSLLFFFQDPESLLVNSITVPLRDR